MSRGRDYRSAEAEQYRKLYKTKRWERMRWAVYARDAGVCHICGRLISGRFDADHVIPHKGDLALFWDESNVKPAHPKCHSSAKQGEERRGYSLRVDERGYPVDRNHPCWTGKI